jgi:hypothetical protein
MINRKSPPDSKVVKKLALVIKTAIYENHKVTNSVLYRRDMLSKIQKARLINAEMITMPIAPNPANPSIAQGLAFAPDPEP